MDDRRVFVSAGEVSGDIAGALLVAELRRRGPNLVVFGTGGQRMRQAGAAILTDTTDIGVVGVTEVAQTLPSVARAYRDIRNRIHAERPDVAVLIGNDLFNVVLARWLRRQAIPTVAYFPPQIWVWRSLARPIANSFDAIVTSFADEHDVYSAAAARGSVTFAGHYLANELRPATRGERLAARSDLALDRDAPIVGVLPGSRHGEISSLAGILFDAAAQLAEHNSRVRFAVAAIESTHESLRALLAGHRISHCTVIDNDSHRVMRSADVVIVASGTASLEAALIGTPMVIVYRVSAITNLIVKAAIRLGLLARYETGLPNLILGRSVVPEVLQERVTAPAIAEEVGALLSSGARQMAMRAAFREIQQHVWGPDAIGHAADIVIDLAARHASDSVRHRANEPVRHATLTPAEYE